MAGPPRVPPKEVQMRRSIIFAMLFASALLTLAACLKTATWSDTAAHKSGFITANGVRLHYLDWGGAGPVLILLAGNKTPLLARWLLRHSIVPNCFEEIFTWVPCLFLILCGV
jgi:hypothetical protein